MNLKTIGIILALMLLAVAIGFGLRKGTDYDADMYVCGEPPDDKLYVCKVGTGPPRTDCGAKQSGVTQTKPGIC